MTSILNQGTNWSTTQDWLEASNGMRLTAYDLSSLAFVEMEIIEPGQAVNLLAAERARMNRANPGVITPPERL
jgi:hypothetical protein